MIKFCKNCYNNKVSNGMCNNGYFWCLKPEIEQCPICNSCLTNVDFSINDFKVLEHISDNPKFYQSMIELYNNNIVEYELKMSQFRTHETQIKQMEEGGNKSKCPRCGGTTFTPMKKKWSILTGFATNQVELVCNNCGYKMKAK